jgi:ABC-type nitrate/sulfonate/bicarbonate transport system substrate-binding protein
MHRFAGACLILLLAIGAARAAAPADPLVMTYVQSNADYWDMAVATQKGFFADEGFAPQFVTNAGSVQSTQLLITRAVQIAITQPEALIGAITHGITQIAAIAAPMRRVDWVLVGQPGMKSLADLKGKTLGFSGLRISEFWLTEQILRDNGLPPGSYDSIQVGTTPAKYAALINGSVGAAILFQPTASQAIGAGFSRLYNLGNSPGYIPGVYIVSRTWAAQNQHGVRLTRALQRAHDWLYDAAHRTEAVGIMTKLSKASDAAVNDVYDTFFVKQKWYTPDCGVDTKAITTAIATLISHNELDPKKAPKLADILLPQSLGGRRD